MNTFHFNSRKTTFILKDVTITSGLPIEGEAVTGSLISRERNMPYLCEDLLGVIPVHKKDTQGLGIKFTWILSTLKDGWKIQERKSK